MQKKNFTGNTNGSIIESSLIDGYACKNDISKHPTTNNQNSTTTVYKPLVKLLYAQGSDHKNILIDKGNPVEVAQTKEQLNFSTVSDLGKFFLGENVWQPIRCAKIYDIYEELIPSDKGVHAKSFNFDKNRYKTEIDFLKFLYYKSLKLQQ